ncbi:MAG: hypothetical protein C4537_02515 [Acholeplasma sp.]|nr:MAG: hypothetical protein C4537_02515 [Acholeplasma sp.]
MKNKIAWLQVFMFPHKFSKDTVPQPEGSSVFIQELKKSFYAVIKFRGYWTDKNYEKHEDILKSYIKDKSYEICSPRFIFRYQPPFIPGIFRHNEIAYQITKNKRVQSEDHSEWTLFLRLNLN